MRAKVQLSLKGRALRWLSMREHSRSELRTKLLRADRPREADSGIEDDHDQAELMASARSAKVEALLDELEQLKYLSDERFVEALSLRRAGRFGVLKLKHELSAHKIATPLVQSRSKSGQSNRDFWPAVVSPAMWFFRCSKVALSRMTKACPRAEVPATCRHH
jgi:SOS response regulatory protein OraA/RecX